MECFVEFICEMKFLGECCKDDPTPPEPPKITWDEQTPWDNTTYWMNA